MKSYVWRKEMSRKQLLNNAIGLGDYNQVNELLSVSPKVFAYHGEALHFAVQTNNFDIVKRLVYHGADISYRDKWGMTTFLMSCRSCRTEYARFLIEREADIYAKDENGMTALFFGIYHDLELVEQLMKNGIDVNQQNITGATMLDFAIISGNIDIVKLALKYGADLSLKNNKGETVFDCAKDKLEILSLLVAHAEQKAMDKVVELDGARLSGGFVF